MTLERKGSWMRYEPKLRAGIEFLAANRDTGCISSRFLREQTIDGEDLQSTSFVGWFDDLASLEAWSKSHSTHLAIFHSFLSTVHLLGRPPKLRLWHEVSVLPEGGFLKIDTKTVTKDNVAEFQVELAELKKAGQTKADG